MARPRFLCRCSRFELGSSCLCSKNSCPLSHTFPAPFVLLTQTTEKTTTTQNANTSKQLGVLLEQLAASSTIPQPTLPSAQAGLPLLSKVASTQTPVYASVLSRGFCPLKSMHYWDSTHSVRPSFLF